MTGTLAGGIKAAETNKQRHGTDFYKKMGQKGGKARVPKGFSTNRALARVAGAKGGAKSKRGPARKKKPVEKAVEKLGTKGGKMNELELTYYGVVTAKKNSKQIIWNHTMRRPMLISNRRARRQEEDMVQSFMLQAYGEGWRGGSSTSTYQIEIQVWNKDRRRRDLDNQATAILDALVIAHVIPDDSVECVNRLSIEYKGQDKEEPRAVIKIREMAWQI